MKLKFFTLLLLSAACVVSCRKINNDPDIKQYDQQQIQSYIAANGLTGMVRDMTMGDTTGTYYQILNAGDTTKKVDYPSTISYVYTIRTFDGKYAVTDTAVNHGYGVLGHVLPNGLMLAIKNNLKYRGGKMRVLIPSHLAYGKSGYGQGSTTLTSSRIGGNQCLDITVNLIDDQAAYDQLVIKNYMAANNLTGYTKTADGLWYKITTAPTGSNYFNASTSTVTMNYSIYLMNNTNPDGNIYATTTSTFSDFGVGKWVAGFEEGLKILGRGSGGISIIVPSALAYGTGGSGNGIPPNECLRWDMTNVTITN
jgi:FKBP-type peptidyl-prolyl cis-trans isomerase FkpA